MASGSEIVTAMASMVTSIWAGGRGQGQTGAAARAMHIAGQLCADSGSAVWFAGKLPTQQVAWPRTLEQR